MEKTAYGQLETQQKHHEDKEKALKKAIENNRQTISEFQKTIKVCFFSDVFWIQSVCQL